MIKVQIESLDLIAGVFVGTMFLVPVLVLVLMTYLKRIAEALERLR